MKGLVDLENNIENEGLESVCNALRNNTRITQLNLSRIKIPRLLFESHHFISDNKISQTGIKALSEMLAANASITELNINCEYSSNPVH